MLISGPNYATIAAESDCQRVGLLPVFSVVNGLTHVLEGL
jgi:hypothetical protein